MDIAILTLSASDNCGSLLQAYALQQILRDIGHKVVVLNYITKKSKKMYRTFHPSYIRSPQKLIGSLFRYKALKSQKKDYEYFRENYLNMSAQKYANITALATADGQYDFIICGSDQVWNVNMRDFDDAYLLRWCKISKKAGYAVSLGDRKNTDSNNLKRKIMKLDDFFAISVREKSALKDLRDTFKCDVKLCLDPTMLLEQERWEAMTDTNVVPKIPFIFYYSYNYEDGIKNRMVAQFAAELGLPVYVINVSRWCDGKEKKYGFNLLKTSGPIAFLSLMQYCKYSLVESFHGVLFSYILKKQFWFLKNTNDDILDDRINDIINILDIKYCFLHPNDCIQELEMNRYYEKPLADLVRLKEESINFLSALSDE